MGDLNKDPNFEKPVSQTPKDKRDKMNMDGVVDELKKLLTGLDNLKKEKEPTLPPLIEQTPKEAKSLPTPFIDPKDTRDVPLKTPQDDLLEEDPDSDFWKGNVLGWPELTETETDESESSFLNPPVSPKSQMEEPRPPVHPGSPNKKEIPPPSPSQESELRSDLPDVDALGSLFPQGPAAAPESEKTSSSKPSQTSKDTERQGISPLYDFFEADTPEEIAETSREKEKEEGSLLEGRKFSNEISLEKLEPPSEPETVESVMKDMAARLKQETPDMAVPRRDKEKPTAKLAVICVGCLFPDGQENKSQQFVSNLKRLGKQKKQARVDIQVVYLQPCQASGVDITELELEAIQAGSEFLFILSSRENRKFFEKKLTEEKKGLWKGRIVLLEQIELGTLYADILTDLERMSHE